MPKLFGVDIAKEISSAFKGQLVIGTLVKVTPGVRAAGDLGGGTVPTEKSHAFEGFMENKTDKRISGTLVTIGGKFVTVLGGSLPAGVEPEAGDRITIEGKTGEIVAVVERDPAAATYKCDMQF